MEAISCNGSHVVDLPRLELISKVPATLHLR